jgi:F-type H+-transporting ATPase subunit b
MTFNLWTFLFEAVNFVVLAYILHRLLYRPLRQAVDARRQAATRAQTEADAARQEAAAVRLKLQTQLTEVEQQRQELIHQAREQAEMERKKLLAEAERAVQQRLEESRQGLVKERGEAFQSLRTEVIAQAVELAGRFLNQAADRSLNGQLALRLVESLRSVPQDERDRLRDEWQPADGGTLETAAALDRPLLDQITAAVTALLGEPINLIIQNKPSLLGGQRLRLGGHVWDGSLSGALTEAQPACPEDSVRV